MRSTCPAFANGEGQSIAALAVSLAVAVHVTDAERTKTSHAGQDKNATNKAVNCATALCRYDPSKRIKFVLMPLFVTNKLHTCFNV